MSSFLKDFFGRNTPPADQVHPEVEAKTETSVLSETALEEVKAAANRREQGRGPVRIGYFDVVRQTDGIFEPSALPTYSLVQLYGQLEAASGLLRFVPRIEIDRTGQELDAYMHKLRGDILDSAAR